MAYIKCKGEMIPAIFGDGSDDDGTGTVTLATATWNPPTVDTGVIEKQYKSLIIPAGVTITAGDRNSGIIIRCMGDCTIAGSIVNQMSPRTLSSGGVDMSSALSAYYPQWMIENGSGGAGGGGAKPYMSSRGGYSMAGHFYGGGYSGGGAGGGPDDGGNPLGGHGGDSNNITLDTGSLFVGGTSGRYNWSQGNPGSNGGGGGGSNKNYGSHSSTKGNGGNGRGARGNNGVANQINAGGGAGNYGGGVVILYVYGTLNFTGTINCGGCDAGGGGGGVGEAIGGGAGSGGGGRIFIIHNGTLTSIGTCIVTSGGNTSYGYPGSRGGAGDKNIITYIGYRQKLEPTPITT